MWPCASGYSDLPFPLRYRLGPWPIGYGLASTAALVVGELEVALWPLGTDAITGNTLLSSYRRGLGDWSALQTVSTQYATWQGAQLVPLSGGDMMAVWVEETLVVR